MGRNLAMLFLIPAVLMFAIPAFGQSDEARRHFDRGMAAVELAKSPEDLDLAIKEFKQATVLAPEWADSHFNLGKVQEAAEKFVDAMASYRKYLRLAPNASDADAVKSAINKLEFKADSVLSVEEIINILTTFASGGEWEKSQGECIGQPFAFIRRKDKDSIEFPGLYGINWGPDTRGYGSLNVKGPVLKLSGISMFCGSADRASSCHFGSEFEIRIESRTRVKVLQLVTGTETSVDVTPARNGYYGCEYKRKSAVNE